MSPEGLNLTYYCNRNFSNLSSIIKYNMAYSITSMLTFLPTAAILCLMVFYRAYRTILQRLFIYLTVSIMLYLAIISLNVQLHPKLFEHTGEVMCKWTGYMSTSAYTCTLLLSFEISVYLLYMMYYQLRGKSLPVLSRYRVAVLELFGLGVAVLVPPALLVISLEYYGLNGAVCWVKAYENTSCKPSTGSLALGKGIFSIYTILSCTNLAIFMVLIGLFCWLSCRFQQSKTRYLHTARRTTILFVFLIAYATIHLSGILFPYFTLTHKLHIHNGEIVLCILLPISQLIRPLAYMFFLNSVKKFRWKSTRSKATEWRDSWKLCCLRLRYWGSEDSHGLLINNNLECRSSEYITPSVETSTHYESVGARTSAE